MAKKATVETTPEHVAEKRATGPTSLASVFSKKAEFFDYKLWLVGNTPLITHAWSEKARREMLGKQTKATKAGKEERKPEEDYVNSQYPMGEDSAGRKAYGFPAMGVKNAILSAAHKDKGVPRTTAMGALWIDAEMVKTRPAMAGAVCNMPLLRIWGSEPQMREDMVKIGAGLSKIANLAYRSQHEFWAIKLVGRLNSSALTPEQLAFLIQEAGMSSGLGEWRTERRGTFGAFHLGSLEEEAAWDRYAAGKGPLPQPKSQFLQAAE